MKNLQAHLINVNAPLSIALDKLNLIDDTVLTLFAVDDNEQVKGTLTDGDIRRGLLSGNTINDKVGIFMNKNFQYIHKGDNDISKIIAIRKKGIKLLPEISKSGSLLDIHNFQKINSLLPLDAVLMAGGRGQRLRPLTDSTPKPMLKLGAKPIIEHNIDRLIAYGVKNIYLSVNYLAEKIENYFGDGSSKGINIHYIREDEPLGTIGSITYVEKFSTEHVLVMNSDLFTNINFENFYLDYLNANAKIAVASIPYSVNIPYAILEREGNRITGLKEKPVNTHYANAGIYLLNHQAIQDIPKNTFYDITDLIEKTIEAKEKVIQSPILGYWIDIGKHDDYQKAQEIVKHTTNDDQ